MKKGLDYCRKAKELGVDIALFPEMWSVGYSIPECIDDLKESAVSADSEFVSTFGKLADRSISTIEKQIQELTGKGLIERQWSKKPEAIIWWRLNN